MDLKLNGKAAIVTGAAGGLGHAIALRLAQEGADLAINDISEEVSRVKEEIEALGRRALAEKADVTKSGEIARFVRRVLDRFGKIDILINNAGGSTGDAGITFAELPEEAWEPTLDLNLKGVLICTKAVIGHMLERKYGRILSVASEAGQFGHHGYPIYSAAKGGVISFTKTLALEVAPYGITVNTVAPHLMIGTGGYERSRKGGTLNKIIESLPMGRVANRDEVAQLVAFLVSDSASYITGCTHNITGGSKIY